MGQTPSAPSSSSSTPPPPLPAQHPPVSPSSTNAQPPPECPMHAAGPNKYVPSTQATPAPTASTSAAASQRPAECPIKHDSPSSETINPLNSMPLLPHTKAPNQSLDLPITRTSSTIPRPVGGESPYPADKGQEDTKVWEYPSPQQFYNALVRKGWETPEEHVETMVEIHNFLNEQAWGEVMRWEKGQRGGEDSQLAKFQGNPSKVSPKARLHLMLGQIFPSKFNTEPPFDRHDWVIHRPVPTDPTGPMTEQRYVIDYYSAPPDEEGNPVFYLDVRPALDGFGGWAMRMGRWWSGEK